VLCAEKLGGSAIEMVELGFAAVRGTEAVVLRSVVAIKKKL